jgi:hypothetical protein
MLWVAMAGFTLAAFTGRAGLIAASMVWVCGYFILRDIRDRK